MGIIQGPCLLGVLIAAAIYGQSVPDFHLNDLAGTSVSFFGLRGDVTVVTFISTVCPVSNAYNDRMSALYRDYRGKGVKFIFVNSNRTEGSKEVQNHAQGVGFPFPVYKDSGNQAADALNAEVTPESYVIDQLNRVVYRGQIDDNRNEARVERKTLRMAIDAMLAGKPVPVAQTKAFGCVIKRLKRTASLTPLDESAFPKLVTSHQGQVVLYNFWATWCEPCRTELPQLLNLQKKLKQRGFELILISADEPEQEADAEKVLKQNGATGPAYRKQVRKDEAFINAIDPQWSGALPALFLYDRSGRKVQSFIGETDVRALEAAISKLL